MRTYIEFSRKKFIYNMSYKMDYAMGILGICLQFFIFWCFYRKLYGSSGEVNGIRFSMVSTSLILSLGLSNAFKINDMFIQQKVSDGSIANDFLKPVNFKMRLLSENLGNIAFRLIFNFLPALIVVVFLVDIEKPASLSALILFTISTVLGFFILWQMSFIVQMASFWIINIWSISTTKDVLINIFSGSMIPLWFMPYSILNIIKFTPFDLIYFTSVRLYLGDMGNTEILFNFGRQIIWICLLFAVGEAMWRIGQRKLIVQGG